MTMQITNQADYALRSMLFIAPLGTDKPIPSNVIAEEMQISRIFLSRINSQLGNAGLIKTRRGARGGIVLAKKPADISIYDILTAVDGNISLIHCTKDPEGCPLSDNCPYMDFWKEAEDLLIKKMKQTSLQDILEQYTPA
ncbi:MAG: RrF2 family transcriptional regulator [Anaerolineaceae bacterium]